MPWGFYVAVAVLAGAAISAVIFLVKVYREERVPSPFHDDTGR